MSNRAILDKKAMPLPCDPPNAIYSQWIRLSYANVLQLARQWEAARSQQNWPEADRIRALLLSEGIRLVIPKRGGIWWEETDPEWLLEKRRQFWAKIREQPESPATPN